MKLLTKIKQFLKLDSLKEQLQRHERLDKSIQDHGLQLNDLVKEHNVLKSNFDGQLIKANGDSKFIQRRYNDHFSLHVNKIKQIKDNLQCLVSEKTKLLKSNAILEDEVNKSILQGCITEEQLQESVIALSVGFEKGMVSGEVLEEARNNFSQLKKVKKQVTMKGQPFMIPVYEKIEENLTKGDKDSSEPIEEKKDKNNKKYFYRHLDKEKLSPEIKQLLDKFRMLPEDEKRRTPLLWWLLGTSTANFKMSKEDASYVDKSQTTDQICANCKSIYYNQGKYICDQVGMGEKGNDLIKPQGWCKLWRTGKNILGDVLKHQGNEITTN